MSPNASVHGYCEELKGRGNLTERFLRFARNDKCKVIYGTEH